MRSLTRAVLLVLTVMLAPGLVTGATESTEGREVLDAVRTLVDAWREASVPKAESVLHKDYRAESWQQSTKGRFLFLETRDELLAQMQGLRPGQWDVRLLRTDVSVDSNGLAVVWAKYEFYFAGKPDHCGHESYTLMHTPQGWKIVNFADSDTPLRGSDSARVCPG
jgi:hypothetical protein